MSISKGIITAMVTPMDSNYEIDFAKTKVLVNHLIEKGVNGLFILGTNGEAHMLSNDEKIAFAKYVIDLVDERVDLYVGVGENSTKLTIELAQKMESVGAKYLSVITPYFIPPTQEELFLHYQNLTKAISIPILLYNMPSRTGINIEFDTLKRLSQNEQVIGIKDSSGNKENLWSYLKIKEERPDFMVFAGSDSLALDLLEAGGDGSVTAISNIMTDTMVNIYKYWLLNDLKTARENQLAIEPFRKLQRLGTIPSILKETVTLSGIDVGPARLPVQAPKEDVRNKIKEFLK